VMDLSSLPFHERCVVLLDQYPWSMCTRVGVGFMIPPVLWQLCDDEQSVWCAAGSFLGILFLLRLGSAIVRRLFPFSREAQLIWKERRQLAKRFDSYQWQKLFWMGIGMAGYGLMWGNLGSAIGALIGFCLIGGGLGALLWVRRNERMVSVH
jgi:hypothetical protein